MTVLDVVALLDALNSSPLVITPDGEAASPAQPHETQVCAGDASKRPGA